MGIKSMAFAAINMLPQPVVNRLKALNLESIPFYYGFLLRGRVPQPTTAIIDPSTLCNLKCPLCPTGLERIGQKKTTMPLELFRDILERHLPRLKRVSLFNWGEPFLNRQIFQIVSHAHERGIFTSIHSNLSLEKDAGFFDGLLDSGLDRLSVSLDGGSQESYQAYRRGGDFDLVVENIRTLSGLKKKRGLHHPQIVWQFIINRFNEDELEQARSLAQELHVQFNPMPIGLSDDLPDFVHKESFAERKAFWLARDPANIEERYLKDPPTPFLEGYCSQLFSRPTITPDGSVYPCCFSTQQSSAFGNILEEPFADIWNNEKYSSARALFTGQGNRKGSTPTVCSGCAIYTRLNKRRGQVS